MSTPTNGPALDGIRVIDLTMGFAGPLATKMLGGLGADVIKVESIQRIDWWRGAAATTPDDVRFERSPHFNTTNLYKRGITLNLRDERGRDLVRRLIETSDVVIENYSARVMANFGLTYETLRGWKRDIIMVSMPGFGASGPWRDYVAFGQTVEAVSGLTHFNGYPDDDPRLLSNGADPFVGINGMVATLLALVHRQRTGEGQRVEVAQMEAITPFIGADLLRFQMNGGVRPRIGNQHESMSPHGCFPTRGDDTWVAIAVETDEQWAAFCRVTEHPDWAADPRFGDLEGRLEHRDELDRLVAEWTAGHDRYEVMHSLQDAGIAAGPVQSGADLRTDAQLQATGFYESLDRAHVGRHEYPVVPIRLSRTPRRLATPAPTLGQHNEDVLGGLLGLSEAELESLREDGVIGDRPASSR